MKAEGRRWMSDEHHQKMQIQRYLNKMASSAFHTQYSIVPTFHYSIFGANSKVQKNLYIISKL
jgi:hypothetical protein